MEEYLKKSVDELEKLVREKQAELQTMRMQKIGNAVKDTTSFHKKKKEIARICTALTMKKHEEAKETNQ